MPESLGVRPSETSVSQNGVFTFNPLNTPARRLESDGGAKPYNSVDVFNNTAEPIEVLINGDPEKIYRITESGGSRTIIPEEDGEKIFTLIGVNRGANSIDPSDLDVGCLAMFKRL